MVWSGSNEQELLPSVASYVYTDESCRNVIHSQNKTGSADIMNSFITQHRNTNNSSSRSNIFFIIPDEFECFRENYKIILLAHNYLRGNFKVKHFRWKLLTFALFRLSQSLRITKEPRDYWLIVLYTSCHINDSIKKLYSTNECWIIHLNSRTHLINANMSPLKH